MDAAKFDALFPKAPTAADAAFEKWMAKVDAMLAKKCGLDSRDLPDWNYLDAFEDGFPPGAAAKAALKAAKDDF